MMDHDDVFGIGVRMTLKPQEEHRHANASTMAEALIDMGRIIYMGSPQPVCLNCLLHELAIQYATLAAVLPYSLQQPEGWKAPAHLLDGIIEDTKQNIAGWRERIGAEDCAKH